MEPLGLWPEGAVLFNIFRTAHLCMLFPAQWILRCKNNWKIPGCYCTLHRHGNCVHHSVRTHRCLWSNGGRGGGTMCNLSHCSCTEQNKSAHSPIGVSFKCPYQHPPWSPLSIGKPAPKIHQWTIYFCRWDLAESIKRSASDRLGDLRFEPGLLQCFHSLALLGLRRETLSMY